MILLEAASATPQGAISWAWAWGIAAGVIVIMSGIVIKLGAIVWSQYKTLNENRMQEQTQHHLALRKKFDDMKMEYRSEKQATNELIAKIDSKHDDLGRRIDAIEKK